jgi:hypothetical protein
MSKEPSKLDRQREMRERQHDARLAQMAQVKEDARRIREGPAPAKPKPLGTVRAPAPTHDQRGKPLDIDEVKAVSAKALAQAPKKKAPDPAVVEVAKQIDQQKAAKAAKQANREGKKPAMAWLDADTAKALKIAAAKHEVTQETIVAEGIAVMLEGKYKV